MIADALRTGKIAILSIDGGGVYGYAAAMVINRLCELAKEPFPHRLFDLVAGTSAGALLAAAYANELSAWAGQEITRMQAPVIFGRAARRFTGYVAGPKYSNRPLLERARATLKNRRLSRSAVDLLIPVYRLDEGEPYFFKSWEARADPDIDCHTVDAAVASAAAPVFFPPHSVPLANGELVHCWDGGLAANNPAACAAATADRMIIEDVLVVSVGTGDKPNGVNPKAAARWGALRNVPRVISAALDGPNKAVDYQLRQRFWSVGDGAYYRFDGPLPDDCGPMDDASPRNMRRIRDYAEDLCRTKLDALKECAEKLREWKS